MGRGRDGEHDAEQLSECKTFAAPGIRAVTELVGHTFAECGGKRHSDHRIADLRDQPERGSDLQIIARGEDGHGDGGQCGAADNPRRAAAERAVGVVGADGDPGVHEERQHDAGRGDPREIGDAVHAGETAYELRHEHDVERGHRHGEQQRAKRESRGQAAHLRFGRLGAVRRGHRIAQIEEGRFEIRHGGVEMRGRRQRSAASRVDARGLRFRTLVGGFRNTRLLLHGKAPQRSLGFRRQGLLIVGAIVDARADEHLAGQRTRLHGLLVVPRISRLRGLAGLLLLRSLRGVLRGGVCPRGTMTVFSHLLCALFASLQVGISTTIGDCGAESLRCCRHPMNAPPARYACICKIARTHCDSAFERFFQRRPLYQHVPPQPTFRREL